MANEGGTGVVEQVQSSTTVSGSAQSTGSTTDSTSQTSTGSGIPNPVTKWEDDPRAKGMLADLQKERKARQDYERKVVEAEARAAERDRQIAALTGAKTPTAQEVDEEAIRARFNQLYPHLGGLTAEDIEALRELKDQRGALTEAVQARWTDHSRGMLDTVFKGISDELGELTPRQRQRIGQVYVAEAEANPEFLKRHDAGDKTLIAEFVKSYLEDTVEPVRRKVTASEVNRQRVVPSGGNRNLSTPGGKPIDPKDDKAVMDFIMESRRGKFGR